MKSPAEMIALQNISKPKQSQIDLQPRSGILSERAAIVICGLTVAAIAIPVLVVIQVLSSVYKGGTTVYRLLDGTELDMTDEI
ncbi:MAG TPA: hypothetical protein V6D50_15555 [Chroococcales cyanobacterium]